MKLHMEFPNHLIGGLGRGPGSSGDVGRPPGTNGILMGLILLNELIFSGDWRERETKRAKVSHIPETSSLFDWEPFGATKAVSQASNSWGSFLWGGLCRKMMDFLFFGFCFLEGEVCLEKNEECS